MSEQELEALKRGAIEGAIAAAGTFIATYQTSTSVETALLAAAGAFVAAVALRYGEGKLDANRQARVSKGTEAPIASDVR